MWAQAGNSWTFPRTIFHQHRWTQPPCCFTKKPDSVNHNVQSNVTAQMLSGLHLVLMLGPTLAVTLSATRPPLARAGSHGSLIRSGSHLRERWWEYKKGSIPKMFGWTCSPFPHLILNKAEKNHTNVVKSGSGYSDSPYPKVSICTTSLHSQLNCILYIHWNKCFGIKRVGGNVITTLISQQGYATPASLRRAHVDIGTAQTWLAEWLCFTCETMKSHFSHVTMSTYILQTVESTVTARQFHNEMLNKNTAKKKKVVIAGSEFSWSEIYSITVLTQWQSHTPVSGDWQAQVSA